MWLGNEDVDGDNNVEVEVEASLSAVAEVLGSLEVWGWVAVCSKYCLGDCAGAGLGSCAWGGVRSSAGLALGDCTGTEL